MTKLLVTGASGHLGQLVLNNLLINQNIAPADIIAGGRDTSKLFNWAAKGTEIRKVDFDDPDLANAFKGVDHLLIISTDALDLPGKRLRQHEAAVAAATKASVEHITYTSMPSPDDSLIPFAPDHFGTEDSVKASGVNYTILRNSWYMENLFMSLPQVLASGKWFTSAADGKVGQVSREDCAAAAAASLVAGDKSNKTFTLTGPEALTIADMAAAASAALNKPIEVIPVSDDQLVQGMISAGVPEIMAGFLVTFDANTRENKVNIVTGDVEALTGNTPKSIKTFFEENKAAFNA